MLLKVVSLDVPSFPDEAGRIDLQTAHLSQLETRHYAAILNRCALMSLVFNEALLFSLADSQLEYLLNEFYELFLLDTNIFRNFNVLICR